MGDEMRAAAAHKWENGLTGAACARQSDLAADEVLARVKFFEGGHCTALLGVLAC